MKCSRCGMEYDEYASFCPQCGAITQKRYGDDSFDVSRSGYNYNNYQNKSPMGTDKIILIVAVVVLTLALVIVASILGCPNSKGVRVVVTPEPTTAPTATPTPTPTPEPIYEIATAVPVTPAPTRVPTPVPDPSSGYYKTYSNSSYGFSCQYPSNFRVYDDGKRTLYTVMSPDGQGRVLIDAIKCSNYPPNDRDAYINSIGGTVTYKAGDGDFYATSVRTGGMIYYKYAKYRNGIRYSFEVIYPQSQYDAYDIIINDIYDTFRIY